MSLCNALVWNIQFVNIINRHGLSEVRWPIVFDPTKPNPWWTRPMTNSVWRYMRTRLNPVSPRFKSLLIPIRSFRSIVLWRQQTDRQTHRQPIDLHTYRQSHRNYILIHSRRGQLTSLYDCVEYGLTYVLLDICYWDHFWDDLPSQSLDWYKTSTCTFSVSQLTDTDKNYTQVTSYVTQLQPRV